MSGSWALGRAPTVDILKSQFAAQFPVYNDGRADFRESMAVGHWIERQQS